ncbi:transferrin receptor protein 2, partial [Patagioenas fasciata]|uniref:transferrin receptor protein 2 n=1 Tax=Patagioenas fasciata TaxID=372321 RepID=UPI003A99846A
METLSRWFRTRPPGGGGAVSYSRHRDPPGGGGAEQEEDGEGGEGNPGVRLPLPHRRPRPRRRLHPMVTLALGSASAFLAGLLVAAIGRSPCGGGAGSDVGDPAPEGEELVGGASAEAPPLPWPRLQEMLQRHLQEGRVEAWVREVSAAPHGAGSERGRGLARAVLNAMVGAGLTRVWSRPQPLPLPTRGVASLHWLPEGGRGLRPLPLDPDAFCAWSVPGDVTGGLVYGHYGRPQDLELLRGRGVRVRGNILLLRGGRGSPAQKVALAAGEGALGVLFYPHPQDTAGPGGHPGLGGDTAVTMNLQEGSGDPWTRGFPSFSGRAPPRPPPGVPPIPALPISANAAAELLGSLGGPRPPPHWSLPPGRGLRSQRRLRLLVGGGTRPGTLSSVFGALQGRLEPDCYIIVGAQRDSLGPGAAASGVGTALLLELASLFAAMGREGFQLRRTLLFVSWDGGEFGHLGATEWLEGYPNLLHTKVAAYISLDQSVLGDDRLVAKISPSLVPLLGSALSQVESPNEGGKSLLEQLTKPGRGWESEVVRSLPPESGAFPFAAAAGIPAMELGFDEAPGGWSRAALGTREDSWWRLQGALRGRFPAVTRAVASLVATVLLALGHQPRLPLDPGTLGDALLRQLAPLQAQGLSLQCLSSARGDIVRAAASLRGDMAGSEVTNERLNRGFNARIMAAEGSLLSPFVSPLVTPFRHVLLGRGDHTLAALGRGRLGTRGDGGDGDNGRRLALLTWTLQGAAAALAGDAWDRGDVWGQWGDSGDNGACWGR